MSTNKTSNLNLNSWEASDPVKRTEFNENFTALDAAWGDLETAKAGIVVGTYTGDGAASRTIPLGFTPKAVYVSRSDGATLNVGSSFMVLGGLALPDHPVYNIDGNSPGSCVEIVDNGFRVVLGNYHSSHGRYLNATNLSNAVYHYLAVK